MIWSLVDGTLNFEDEFHKKPVWICLGGAYNGTFTVIVCGLNFDFFQIAILKKSQV